LERESHPIKEEPVEEDSENSEPESDDEAVKAKREEKENTKKAKFEKKSGKGIDYERLSEFFFDLCLSWCQFLDVETFLFFINGVFLNITRGQHVNMSVFRDIEDIPTLSIEFFNHLLAYRAACAEA
jgi:hypothetical protein